MTTRTLEGYIVRETEKAIAFVAQRNAKVAGVKPLWVPRSKVVALVEGDAFGERIATANDGERLGIPFSIEIDGEFANRVMG